MKTSLSSRKILRYFMILAAAAMIFSGCISLPSPALVPPDPLAAIEGHASFQMTGERATVKSRFSFVFFLPDKGRVEVTALMGQTISLLLTEGQTALFALPSKKVYWRGGPEEIFEKFLGFGLTLREVISLLSGQWRDGGGATEGGEFSDWVLKRDDQQRVVGGQKESFIFTIKEFFARSRVPRVILFVHSEGRGRIKILNLGFPRAPQKDVFNLSFVENKKFRPVSWEEIERLLRNEH